jgi:hypothetical protein
MRKSILPAIAVVGFFATTAAFANTYAPSTITVDTVGAQDSNGEYFGPYQGKFGGITTNVYCDDFNHNIFIGAAPTNVNVSDLTNLSLTRFGGAGATTTLADALVDYEKIFYLSSFLSGSYSAPTTFYGTFASGTNSANTLVAADIQDALWSFYDTTPQAANGGTNQVNYWLDQAAANYTKYSYANFRILTDSGNQYGGVQELFVSTLGSSALNPTPEPGTIGMLFGGVAAIAFGGMRRRNRKTGLATAK